MKLLLLILVLVAFIPRMARTPRRPCHCYAYPGSYLGVQHHLCAQGCPSHGSCWCRGAV